MSKLNSVFREKFKLPSFDLLRWFPGHMSKGMRQMQQKLKSIDCIIEVHDARIPFTGRNPDFARRICGIKPHILVFNKKDLIPDEYQRKILDKVDMPQGNVIFTNCKDQTCSGVGSIVPRLCYLINKSNRFNRLTAEDFSCMIIGVPNIGKSSLINTLRNRRMFRGKASPVGAKPGITRSVLTRVKINERPPVYLFDTPGILTPTVSDIETGMRLALCECLLDHLVGEDIMADYLLYWLNKHEKFDYVPLCHLKEPTDSILKVLSSIAFAEQKMIRKRDLSGSVNSYVVLPDLISAAKFFLNLFREGKLGKIILDQKHLTYF